MTHSHHSPKLKIYHDQIEGTRGKQEDTATWYEYPDGSGGCAIVADGIGGGGDGDKASKTVVAAFVRALGKYGNDLKIALTYANAALLKAKERKTVSDSRSCGCTLVAVSIVHGWLSYISVGDSNIFLHKKGCVLGSHVNFHHSAGGSKITSAVTGYFELVGNPGHPNQKPFDYRENFAYFEPGDRLILSSDGMDTYEPRRGCYDRLSNLLLKYPVGGSADVQTIVSHILNELEKRVAGHLEMARMQQWTPQQIKLIQDNATILMVEAWEEESTAEPATPAPHTQPPQPSIPSVSGGAAFLPPVNNYQQPAGGRAAGASRPLPRQRKPKSQQHVAGHSEEGALPLDSEKQMLPESKKQRLLLLGGGVVAAVVVLGLIVGGLLSSGDAETKPKNGQPNNSSLQPNSVVGGGNSSNPAASATVVDSGDSTQPRKQNSENPVNPQKDEHANEHATLLGNIRNADTFETLKEYWDQARKNYDAKMEFMRKFKEFLSDASKVNDLNDLNCFLEIEDDEAKNAVKDRFSKLVNNETDVAVLADMYSFEKENFTTDAENPVIVPLKVKSLLRPNSEQFDADFLKALGKKAAIQLWEEVVIPEIQSNVGTIFNRIPKGLENAEWEGESDPAPESWKLLCYMSKLVEGQINGLPGVGEPVWDEMGGEVAEVCKNKVNTINEQKEVDKFKNDFDSALMGDDAQKLLDAYNAYQAKVNDNQQKEIDNQVKGWLQPENKLNYKKRYIKCAKANAEKFISLYYEIVESKLSDKSSPENLKKLILGDVDFESVSITMRDQELNYLYDQINHLINDYPLVEWEEKFRTGDKMARSRRKYRNIVRILDGYFSKKNNNNAE